MLHDLELVKIKWFEVKEESYYLQKRKTKDERNERLGAISKKKKTRQFKFTKKLFVGEKIGVLNITKEDLAAQLRKKYTDLLTDIPLGRLSEPNRPHPMEEKFDHSPLKLAERKDFFRKARR